MIGNPSIASSMDAKAPSTFGADSFVRGVARRRRYRNQTAIGALVLLLLIAVLPVWFDSQFQLGRLEVAMAYIIAAIGLNISLGYAGELTLGHPVVMAAGAYTAGILSATFGWSFLAVLPIGILGGVLVGIVIMLPGIRVQGWYLALITLFAVLVMPRVVILAEVWTGGEFGLTGVKRMDFFGWYLPAWGAFELVLVCLGLSWLLTTNLMRSSWGYRFQALRDSRRAAEAAGINLARTRFAVYVLSAIPAALAGVLLAYTEQYVNADSFGISLALLLLTGVVLGGSGTVWGPIVGMVPLVGITFWVGPFSPYNAIALGLGLLIGALAFTNGLVPAIAQLIKRRGHNQVLATRSLYDVPLARRMMPAAAGLLAPNGGDSAATSQPPIVRVARISKRFGGLTALDDVGIELWRGALVGLVGPNGSGKSTFLNVLSGFIAPDAGSIEIAGKDVTGLGVDAIAQKGVGRTFQVPQLVEEATALQNIEIGLIGATQTGALASALRLPFVTRQERQRHERAMQSFIDIGLPESAIDLPASALPLGLKRIVEVGRAIVSAPALLLLDEPAAGLNDEERQQLGLLLQKLKQTGMTILVVEHNVSFVMAFCEELLLLESGAITCRSELGADLPERIVRYLNYTPDLGLAAVAGT
jgi:branched-chain amino acid transport system permease protein